MIGELNRYKPRRKGEIKLSRKLQFSVVALYQFNNKLFDKMKWPDGFTDDQKETVIFNIMEQCGNLELLYPDYPFMYDMIGLWSKYNYPEWNRIYKASLLSYNPIENYNRSEIETIDDTHKNTHNNSDRVQSSGTDSASGSQTHFGKDTNTNSNTAYDSNTLRVHDDSVLSYGHNIADSSSTTYGKADTRTQIESTDSSGKVTRNNHTSGNIGVTTSQQMLEQEKNIALALNIFPIICESFKQRFCIEVY